jgi:CFEM domain
MKFIILASLLPLLATAKATTPSTKNIHAAILAKQIPACATMCVSKAVKSVGCDPTDYSCQCAKMNTMGPVIHNCLKLDATCKSRDLARMLYTICYFDALLTA